MNTRILRLDSDRYLRSSYRHNQYLVGGCIEDFGCVLCNCFRRALPFASHLQFGHAYCHAQPGRRKDTLCHQLQVEMYVAQFRWRGSMNESLSRVRMCCQSNRRSCLQFQMPVPAYRIYSAPWKLMIPNEIIAGDCRPIACMLRQGLDIAHDIPLEARSCTWPNSCGLDG